MLGNKVRLKIQVISMENNNNCRKGDIIKTLYTTLNEGRRPKTTISIKGDELIWIEEINNEESVSYILLDNKTKQ